MKKSSIYTGTGDNGTTSLVGGKRILKSDIRLEAYGTIDELNSFIGLLVCQISDEHDRSFLMNIQNRLFRIGANLATDQETSILNQECTLSADELEGLEHEIDRIDASLPKLSSFIIPGGCASSSYSNICRSITRRAERHIVSLSSNSQIDFRVMEYINRLSDYFFVLGRKINIDENCPEKKWDKNCR